MRVRALLAAVVVAVSVGCPAMATAASSRPVVAAYFYDRDVGFDVGKIPTRYVTDVIYSAATVGTDGRCHLGDPWSDIDESFPGHASSRPRGNFGELEALKRRHPGLESEISIGGWSRSVGFSRVVTTAARRAAFVSSCVSLLLDRWPGVFDGIDIDWEFPVHGGAPGGPWRPAERAQATLLLRAFRAALDRLGARRHRYYLLTAALPAGRWQEGGAYDPSSSWQLAAVASTVDWINLMAYDMNNALAPRTNFNSPLSITPGDPTLAAVGRWNSASGAVRYYESAGVPADRIVLGVPFYGHVFDGVPNRDHGLFQPFDRLVASPSYAQIISGYLPTFHRYWSPWARAPWLYDPARRTFVSYDDPSSIAAKARFAVAARLRGVGLWEISQDDAQHSLLRALATPVLGAGR
jgi:chitinase